MEGLGQVVGDEAVARGQEVATVLGHLPAGNIGGEAVHHRQVELGGQGLKQVVLVGIDHLLHRHIDVADEAQAGIGDDLGPAGKAAIGHEVLHDLDGVRIFDLDPADLIEGDGVPKAHQADLAALVVVKERGLGGLAAGDQGGVGGEFAEEVGLARAARPQFDIVVVGLHQRRQAGDEMQPHPRRELVRFQPHGTQHHRQPLVPGEGRPAGGVAREIEAGQLDRAQVLDGKGVVVLLDVVVRQGHLGPDPALQQAVVVAVELFADGNALGVEVLQRRPVALLLLHVAHMDLVDEAVPALGCHLGLGGIGLVGADIVFLEGGEHGLHAGVQLRLVIAGAELGEQKLQDEGRDVGALLDPVQQVLAQHLAVKGRVQFQVEGVHRAHSV